MKTKLPGECLEWFTFSSLSSKLPTQTASGQSWEEDLAVLLGLLLSDGEVNNKSNKILFSNKSEALHEVFKEKLESLFGIQKFTSWIDKKGVKITEVKNKDVREFLTKFLSDFRRKKVKGEERFPSLQTEKLRKLLENKNNARKFLQAFFSGDGSVVLSVKWHKRKSSWVFSRRVQVSCKNPSLRKFVAALLKTHFHMKPSVWDREIALERREDIQKFAEEINFLPSVRISRKSKNWFGIEKKALLEVLLKTFGISTRSFKKKEKEEIIESLIKLLPTAERVQVSTGQRGTLAGFRTS